MQTPADLIKMPMNSAKDRKTMYCHCPLAKWLFLITTTTIAITLGQLGGAQVAATSMTISNPDFSDFLHSENVLIENLRNYIETLEEKIKLIKSKTLEIKSYHDVALNDTAKYVYNPLNALTLLKRFTLDWNVLRDYAGNFEHENEIVKNISSHSDVLHFPSDDDFDEAVDNLLRIQEVYKLEPALIALGEINGVKFGSEMSWSDCFEVGQKSGKNGEYAMAKYWMKTALDKLTAASVTQTNATTELKSTESQKAKFRILESIMNSEYKMGNIEAALGLANELLILKPKDKVILETKVFIADIIDGKSKTAQNYNKKKKQHQREQQQKHNKKSTDELLIDEICREVTTTNTHHTTVTAEEPRTKYCTCVGSEMSQLLLQPVKQELLSVDPFIAIYHNVLSTKEVDDLKNLLDILPMTTDSDNSENLEFTKLAKRKLATITKRLQQTTGHSAALFGEWKPKSIDFENGMVYETMLLRRQNDDKRKIVANVMFNLQLPKLGGSIVFPQLELKADVPLGAVLYWTNLNEFREDDYRSKQYVCHVIAGTKLFAASSIQSVF